MRRTVAVSTALLLLLVAASIRPQTASAQLAPADSAAVLLEAAVHFEQAGQQGVARALLQLIVERFGSTAAATEARAHLSTAHSVRTAGAGRVELQVWSTLYGLWLGVAIPGALGADNSEAYGAGLLVGGPVGFFAGKALSRSGTITEGQARAVTLGGTWGSWQGYGWTEVLDWGASDESCDVGPYGTYCYGNEVSGEKILTGMVLGGVAGIATGALLSRGPVSPGVATSANFGALWGSWFGFAGGYLAGLEDDKLLATTLLAGDAGLASMALLAPSRNISRSRARMVSLYGVVGGLSGLGIDLLALSNTDDDKLVVAIPMATSALGLALGVRATRNYDPGVESGGTASSGGLLNRTDGQWSLGMPQLLPRFLELDTPAGLVRKPAVGVSLLSARFF